MASYFDILKKLFYDAGYPIHFILNVYGKSGSGKTSLIKAICSPSQTFSFRGGKRRSTILQEIEGYHGHTILVDDYHPAECNSDRDRQAALKDSLVRAIEEKADFPNIIISSEYLDGHMSMQDREIQIFLDENLNWRFLQILEQNQAALEKIRTAFYVQIVSNTENVIADIRQFCARSDDIRTSDQPNNFRSNRYVDYICCADYLFNKYFVCKYNIGFQSKNTNEDLRAQLQRQTAHMQIIKSLEQKGTYLIALRDMLLNENVLQKISDWKEFIPSSDTFHVDSKGIISISPKALLYGMMRYLQSNTVPVKKIINELQTAEALITYENDKELTKKHYGKRIYRIDGSALMEYCSFFE